MIHGSEINAFDPFDACPKCLHQPPYLNYVAKYGPNCQSDCPECEHFHVECGRCRYTWRMHTAATMKSIEEGIR